MEVVGKAIGTLLKRPFIILVFAIIIFIYLVLDRFNPTFTLIFGLTTLGKDDILGSIVALLQLLLQPGIILRVLLFLGAFVVGVSLLCGLAFSGGFNVISSFINRKNNSKHDFSSGIYRYFIRNFILTFIIITAGIILVLMLMVASVPAIVVSKAAAGKLSFLIVAILLDFITLGTVFFGLMFFRIYMMFWYPAIFDGKKAFSKAKQLVDAHFWGILGRILLLDIIFIIPEIFFIQPNDTIVFFIANWIFKTIYFSFYATYIFTLFKFFKNGKDLSEKNPDINFYLAKL